MPSQNDPWFKPKLTERLKAAFSHSPRNLVIALFAAFGVAFTTTEAMAFFFSVFDDNRGTLFGPLLVVVLLGGLYIATPRRLVSHKLGSTTIQIGFGDLLQADGVRIVAVNDFFDAEVGDHVSPTSLHGLLITTEYGNDADAFAAAVDKSLAGYPSETVNRRSGRTKRYAIGTTARINRSEHRYVLVVLAETDVDTLKVNADLEHLAHALTAAWNAARDAAGGMPVSVPLLGGGQSSVGLAEQQLATILLASAIEANGRQQIASLIRIILPAGLYGALDLDALLSTT